MAGTATFPPDPTTGEFGKAKQLRRPWGSAAMIVPLVLFQALFFVVPIIYMLSSAFVDVTVRKAWPDVTTEVARWDGASPPHSAIFEALVADVARSLEQYTLSGVVRRIAFTQPELADPIRRLARRAEALDRNADIRSQVVAIDPRFAEADFWRVIKRLSSPLTLDYVLKALDLQPDGDGGISRVAPSDAIFLPMIARTIGIALSVTVLCLAIGFPVALVVANARGAAATALGILIVIPLWISVVARIFAWLILLQSSGVINQLLLGFEIIDAPLKLVYNRFGVVLAMVHVLLPFMILPIYSVMRMIPDSPYRAAISLGASPATAFRKVYLPQAKPGIVAGCLLVFITSLGFYLTPAILGGPSDQMLSTAIAYYTIESANAGVAAALSLVLAVLIACMLPLYLAYARPRQEAA